MLGNSSNSMSTGNLLQIVGAKKLKDICQRIKNAVAVADKLNIVQLYVRNAHSYNSPKRRRRSH